ncbi:MAG: NAD-dependent epimerase/dehydratase family protein, partial [Acidimicrobiales bacterium]
VQLERTEYVRSDESYSILARIVKAARIDTIVHTFLVVDSTQMSARTMHEINVIGTMNLFAAASAPDSTVRDVVVKSSTLVYGADAKDPVWFSEESRRAKPPSSAVERSLLQVESYVRDFAIDNPDVSVAVLRFSNVLGPDITTAIAKLLEMPVVPSILGFDPRFQFVHEADVVRAILFALDTQLQGIYNVAGDGLLPWSEVAALCGKRTFPLPPYGMGLLAAPLNRLGLVELPRELLELLRHGRGVDNRRLKQAGFEYHYTSAGTVADFVEALRVRRLLSPSESSYQYERDVEQFFRHSPAVVRDDATT